jgi:hypothetical protein
MSIKKYYEDFVKTNIKSTEHLNLFLNEMKESTTKFSSAQLEEIRELWEAQMVIAKDPFTSFTKPKKKKSNKDEG